MMTIHNRVFLTYNRLDDLYLTCIARWVFFLQGSEGAPVNKQAIRVRRLTQSVFTSVPKIEEKKEKVMRLFFKECSCLSVRLSVH